MPRGAGAGRRRTRPTSGDSRSRRVARADQRTGETRAVRCDPATAHVADVSRAELGHEGADPTYRRGHKRLKWPLVRQAVRRDHRSVAKPLARDIDHGSRCCRVDRTGRAGQYERRGQCGSEKRLAHCSLLSLSWRGGTLVMLYDELMTTTSDAR